MAVKITGMEEERENKSYLKLTVNIAIQDRSEIFKFSEPIASLRIQWVSHVLTSSGMLSFSTALLLSVNKLLHQSTNFLPIMKVGGW